MVEASNVAVTLRQAINDECGYDLEIRRDMTASSIEGWDSLAHVRIILNLEARLGTEIDMDATYRCETLGDLIDLVATA